MIKIPIYFHTDETEQFNDLGIKFTLSDAETRVMRFMEITAYTEGKDPDEDKPFSLIYAGGEVFESPLSVEQLDELFEEK
jgi:hypothetical protein